MDCRFYLLHLNKLAIFDNNFYECLIYITVGVKLGLTGNTRIINVVKCVFYFSRLSSTCILDCGKQHTYGIVCLRGQCRRCAAVNVGVLFYICLDLRIIGICEEDNRETYAIYCAAAKLKELTVKVVAKGGNGGRLFGAVTSKEIADALQAQHGIAIPKTKIVQDEPIKAFGGYELKVKLGYEVTGTLKVVVAEA